MCREWIGRRYSNVNVIREEESAFVSSLDCEVLGKKFTVFWWWELRASFLGSFSRNLLCCYRTDQECVVISLHPQWNSQRKQRPEKKETKNQCIVWAMKTGKWMTMDLEEREHTEMMSLGSPKEWTLDWSWNCTRKRRNQYSFKAWEYIEVLRVLKSSCGPSIQSYRTLESSDHSLGCPLTSGCWDWITFLGIAIKGHLPDPLTSVHKVAKLFQSFALKSDVHSPSAPSKPGGLGILLSINLPVPVQMSRESVQLGVLLPSTLEKGNKDTQWLRGWCAHLPSTSWPLHCLEAYRRVSRKSPTAMLKANASGALGAETKGAPWQSWTWCQRWSCL